MSDVALQISMKNYHITTGNGLVRCTSTAKFTAVKYKWKNCDCFLVWMQIDRIFRQGHCILTILDYVRRISSLGACNGALFMAQPHHH